MQGGYFSYALLTALAIALLAAAYSDLRWRLIDNRLTGAIALAAPLFWWSSGLGWLDISFQLTLAAATFLIMTLLFMLRAMGGGDVKLLAAVALWIAPLPFMALIMVMAVAGGVVALAAAAWHRHRQGQGRAKVPYGVAIAAGGIWVLVTHYLPALQAPAG